MISMSPSVTVRIVNGLSNHFDAMVLDWADELKKVYFYLVEVINVVTEKFADTVIKYGGT